MHVTHVIQGSDPERFIKKVRELKMQECIRKRHGAGCDCARYGWDDLARSMKWAEQERRMGLR